MNKILEAMIKEYKDLQKVLIMRKKNICDYLYIPDYTYFKISKEMYKIILDRFIRDKIIMRTSKNRCFIILSGETNAI